MFIILYFSKQFCSFSLVPHSNPVRWVEAHSANKGTEIQNPDVTARNLASGLFIKGGNTLLGNYGFKVWLLFLS